MLSPGQHESIAPLVMGQHSIPERQACFFSFSRCKNGGPGRGSNLTQGGEWQRVARRLRVVGGECWLSLELCGMGSQLFSHLLAGCLFF